MDEEREHLDLSTSNGAGQGGGRLSREDLLRRALAGGVLLTVPGVLAPGIARAGVEEGAQRRGGRLRAAYTTGSAETLDAHNATTELDVARIKNLFDRLVDFDSQGRPRLALATEITPNRKGDVWTVRLKQGVLFHNGKELTADDVVFSYRRILDKSLGLQSTNELAPFLEPTGIRKVDKYSVRLQLARPLGDLRTVLASRLLPIIPDGFSDFDRPVGTGAFKFKSWEPGQSSTFVRNPDWWGGGGKPYLDELVLIPMGETATRVNALLGRQVEAINNIDPAQVKTLQSRGMQILNSPSGGWTGICMASKRPPFADVRVRQAFRLMANRKEMIAKVLRGFGAIGNDLFSPLDPLYARDIPQREQDLAKARALLKAAGKRDLTVTIATSDVAIGMLNSAILFAQQAKKAGVNVKINRVPSATYWEGFYMKTPFFQTFWGTRPLESQMFQAVDSNAPFNETQWTRPKFDKLIRQAFATVDPAKRRALWHDAQEILWETGGYLLWGFPNNLDALAPNVRGLKPHVFRALGWSSFEDVWLA